MVTIIGITAGRGSALPSPASSRAWWAAMWLWPASRARGRCLPCAYRAALPH